MSRAGCRYIKLKDAASLIIGNTPARKHQECYALQGLPWAKIENLNQGEIYETTEYLSSEGERRVKKVPKDAVLISVIGTIGKVGIAGTEMATNQQIISAVFLPESGILPKYAYYYFRYSSPKLQKMAYRTVETRITRARLEQFVLPVPGPEVQRQIVLLMEASEKYIRQQQEKRLRLEQFLESLLAYQMSQEVLEAAGKQAKELKALMEAGSLQAELLFGSMLHRVFHEWEEDKNGRYLAAQHRQNAEDKAKQLPKELAELLSKLSLFQKSMYLEFYRQEEPKPIHRIFEDLKKHPEFWEYHMQDARASAEILRQLGLLQKQEEERIYYQGGKKPAADGRGMPLGVETWECVKEGTSKHEA